MSKFFSYFLGAIVLTFAWHLAAIMLGEYLLPKPWQVLVYFVHSLQDPEFLLNMASSFYRVVLAIILAFVTAFPLGLLLGYNKRADYFIAPYIFLSYPIPKIVLLPIFFTLFGLGEMPRIMLIALTIFYQIVVVTRDSTINLDPKFLDSFNSLSGNTWQKIRHVLIPAALPDAITSLRVASGTAVAVLFMVESFASNRGLGYLIMDAWSKANQLEMFSAILALSLIGVLIYEFFGLLEAIVCKWKIKNVNKS